MNFAVFLTDEELFFSSPCSQNAWKYKSRVAGLDMNTLPNPIANGSKPYACHESSVESFVVLVVKYREYYW